MPGADHRPCPMASTYQLVRNVLAACVRDDGSLDFGFGHTLVLYDARNPAMALDGGADRQWRMIVGSLAESGILRRLSWQSFLGQWSADPALDWLKGEVQMKYGLV